MPVTVNLVSNTQGTLKNFLNSYFQKDSRIDDDVIEWVNVFNKPLEAIDIITAALDNLQTFDLNLWISMDAGLMIEITEKNVNEIIKFMIFRFYKQDS